MACTTKGNRLEKRKITQTSFFSLRLRRAIRATAILVAISLLPISSLRAFQFTSIQINPLSLPQTLQSKPIQFEMSRKQFTALEMLKQVLPGIVWELLYGGAKGGGKSVFLCEWSFVTAIELADEFELLPTNDLRKIPVIGFLGRKRGVEFNSTTLLTWKRFIPSDRYQLRMLEGKVPVIVIDNRVALMYGGMDNSDLINKFNSAELMFAAIDQAEEITEEDHAKIRGSMRLQLNIAGRGVPLPPKCGYKMLLSANPADNWLKRFFIRAPSKQPNTAYLQALPTDNPFLPDGYIENLRLTYAFNPAMFNALVLGSWDDLDQAFVIIPRRRIEACVNNKFVSKLKIKKVTVADISGESENSDETVIGNFENEALLNMETYAHRDLMDTVGRIAFHAKQNGSSLICIDKVGEGSGVYSRVREMYDGDKRMRVYGFDGRISPPNGEPKITYFNYKSYAWFTASKGVIANKRCSLPADEEMIRQLSGVRYRYVNGKLALIPKEQICSDLGCSSDRADMYIMGLDALQYAPVVEIRDRWAPEEKKTYKWNPATA